LSFENGGVKLGRERFANECETILFRAIWVVPRDEAFASSTYWYRERDYYSIVLLLLMNPKLESSPFYRADALG
jgi:hypothetical protein